MHAGKRISTSCGDNSWQSCKRPAPTEALNANLTSRAAITSPSTSALPHVKLSPRLSSTLYDAHEPRLRLTRGKTSKYSGRLRQAQTTRGEGQASQKEQFDPAMRRLPRQGIVTWRQYDLTVSDVRRDVPAPKHCNLFCISPCAPPLETIKGRGGQRSQGLDFLTIIHYHPGPGNKLLLPTSL
jgi:hypothetical protein